MDARQRIRLGLLVLFAIAAAGTAWYWFIEGWSFMDSLYMTVVTVSTVGFAEIRPLDATGQAFTIALIVFGVGAVLYSLAALWAEVLESELFQVGRRRMQRQLAKLDGHTVVCGYGRVGRTIAEFLRSEGPVVVVDTVEHRCDRAVTAGYFAVHGDATDDAVLAEAGLARASILIVSLQSDGDAISVALSAQAQNPDLHVVARANASHNEAKLMQAGVDHVVNPLEIGAKRIAAFARQPAVADFIDVVMHGGPLEYSLEEMVLPTNSPIDGLVLSEARIRDGSGGALILALRDAQGTFHSNPPPSTSLRAGTTLIVIGTAAQHRALGEYLRTGDVRAGNVDATGVAE